MDEFENLVSRKINFQGCPISRIQNLRRTFLRKHYTHLKSWFVVASLRRKSATEPSTVESVEFTLSVSTRLQKYGTLDTKKVVL